MANFQLSPGVVSKEIDLTNFIPAVGASGGASVGQFVWGPVEKYSVINTSTQLQQEFGKPTDANYVDWFSVSNFLSYTQRTTVVRVVDDGTALNSTIEGGGVLIKNDDHFQGVLNRYLSDTGTGLVVTLGDTGGVIDAVTIVDGGSGYSESMTRLVVNSATGTGAVLTPTIVDGEITAIAIENGGTGYDTSVDTVTTTLADYIFAAKYPGVIGDSLKVVLVDSGTHDELSDDIRNLFDSAPDTSAFAADLGATNDELHVVVIDEDGLFTGVPGQVLERFSYLSKAVDAKGLDGEPIFYGSVINNQSKYIRYISPPLDTHPDNVTATYDVTTDPTITDNWGQRVLDPNTGVPRKFKVLAEKYEVSFESGLDGDVADDQDLIRGYAMFENEEEVDVSLIFVGDAGGSVNWRTVVQYVIDNVAERRKDCVVFFSPQLNDVLNRTQSDAQSNVVASRQSIARSTSYAFMDSGWKLQYDVFNDKYRWIPLNSDTAGLCAQTDYTNDPWWSPAGFNRGRLKNVVSLAFNPNKASRDELYKNQINPVVTFTNDGTVLYGDKTLLAKSSAFSYLNVRRLFIVLRKAISRAAKYTLFEFNDQFTRAQFVSMVEPYLREVQGRRGLYDYLVKCDAENNTPEVIDQGQFIASIFLKPARSINFITLNFVAVRTGVEFDEVVGSV